MAENMGDSKKLWRILKSIYSNDTQNCPTVIKFQDCIEHNPEKIANKLNLYFLSSIYDLNSSLRQHDNSNDNYINLIQIDPKISNFTFATIDYETLLSYIDQVSEKKFHDNINGKVIKDASSNSNFFISLLDLINSSFNIGIFPDNLKISTITPILKVKGSSNCSDLRPINNLPVIDKIIEKIAKDPLKTIIFLRLNNLDFVLIILARQPYHMLLATGKAQSLMIKL
jgi:hypothetical protein